MDSLVDLTILVDVGGRAVAVVVDEREALWNACLISKLAIDQQGIAPLVGDERTTKVVNGVVASYDALDVGLSAICSDLACQQKECD